VSPLAIELLRRLSLLALALSVVLLVVPTVLSELGVWGPGLEEQLDAVDGALQVARVYGARPEDPSHHEAEKTLAEARHLAQTGSAWRARQVAKRAAASALQAQREALTARAAARRQAASAASDIDRRLNELEDLYAHATRDPSASGAQKKALLPLMKEARRAGAGVLLAIEEAEYDRAFSLQADAVATLEKTRQGLVARQLAEP
jgi:hypothetical protein